MADEGWGPPAAGGGEGWGAPASESAAFAQASEKDTATAPSTEWRGYIPTIQSGAGRGLFSSIGKTLSGLAAIAPHPNEEDNPELAEVRKRSIDKIGETGKDIDRFGQRLFPMSQTEQDSITGRVASGVSGAAVPLVIGAATRSPGLAIGVGAAQQGLIGAAEQFERAEEKGADVGTGAWAARTAALTNAAMGAIPFQQVLKPIYRASPGLGNWAMDRLHHALKSGVTFATVGEAQHWLNEQIAGAFFDPNASYSFDMKRAAAGFLSGSALGAAFGRSEKGKPPPRNLSPDEQAVFDRIADPEQPWRLPSFKELYRDLKDDLSPLKEAERILAPGQEIPAGESPYIMGRLTRGSAGKAEHFIEHGTFDPETYNSTGPSLMKVLEPVSNDMDGFRAYMLARRAVELDDRGIQTGVPMAEAHAVVAAGNGRNSYTSAFANLQRYQESLLSYLEKSGLLSKDAIAQMRDLNKDYVPFYRVFEDAARGGGGPGGRDLKTYSPVYRIKGSEEHVADPIKSIAENTFMFVALADRNIALQKLQSLWQNSPHANDVMIKQPPRVKPITVTEREIMRAFNDPAVKQIIGNVFPPDEITIFRPQAFRPAHDEIAIYNNGKPTIYKTDPFLASAINGLDREGLNLFTKLAAIPARTLRAGVTLSPEYMGRNFSRDQLSAFVYNTLGRGYMPVYDFFRGLGHVLGESKAYKDWLKGGGAQSTLVSIDRDYLKHATGQLNNPSLMGRMKNVITNPLDGLRALGEVIENSTRLGEFSRLRNRGADVPSAAYASREATLDFQRLGAKMRGLNSMVEFLNAHVEGIDRTAREFAKHPVRATLAAAAAITVPSVSLWYANYQDPRWKEIPRWEKDLFWIIMSDRWVPISAQDAEKMPKGYVRRNESGELEANRGSIYRIPKPHELGVMFGSVPERLLEAFVSENPHAYKNLGKTLGNVFLPNVIPTAFKPLVEQYADSSLFLDRPLTPAYLKMRNIDPSEHATPWTSDTAKLAGRGVSQISQETSFASPIVLENYVRAWTGGMGMAALAASDKVLRGLGITPSKVEPTLTNSDRVLIRAFAVRFPESGANSIQDFYEEANKRERARNTARYLDKRGDSVRADAIRQDRDITVMTGLRRAISNQMKLVRDTYENPNMSPEEKREFIDMSYFQAIKMAQEGLEQLRANGRN